MKLEVDGYRMNFARGGLMQLAGSRSVRREFVNSMNTVTLVLSKLMMEMILMKRWSEFDARNGLTMVGNVKGYP